MALMQYAGARWCSWCDFISLMMLWLWLRCQFIFFMIQFFRATLAIAENNCAIWFTTAGASHIATTFRWIGFLFLMHHGRHFFDAFASYNYSCLLCVVFSSCRRYKFVVITCFFPRLRTENKNVQTIEQFTLPKLFAHFFASAKFMFCYFYFD